MATSYTNSSVKPLYRGTQVVWYILYIIQVLLVFRFFLKFLSANPAAEFTQLIYNLSYIFAQPFLYVIPSQNVSGQIIEWSTLLAMVVYWALAWAIVKIFLMGRPISTTEAHEGLQRQDSDTDTM